MSIEPTVGRIRRWRKFFKRASFVSIVITMQTVTWLPSNIWFDLLNCFMVLLTAVLWFFDGIYLERLFQLQSGQNEDNKQI